MTSWTSFSSRGRALLASGLVAALMGGCGTAAPRARSAAEGWAAAIGPKVRLAVLPPANLSGATVPLREISAEVQSALGRRGLEVVSEERVERFLAKRRLRYTAGLDAASATAASEDMGVEGVVVTAVEAYVPGPPPRFAVTLRLVAAGEDATLLWIDGASRSGDDSPGLFDLGRIDDIRELQRRVLRHLADSLAAALDGTGPRAPACPGGRRFRPRMPYRSPLLAPGNTYSVAVVPFRDLTRRRGAGEVVALAFARQLATRPAFRVIEPGIVRDLLLRFRIVMEGGVSLDQVRSIVGALGADLVVAGDVLGYDDAASGGAPRVNFTTTLLDGHSGKIAWQSTSYNHGDDGVFFFDLGTVHTAEALTCRMVRSTVDGMLTGKVARTPALAPQGEPPVER